MMGVIATGRKSFRHAAEDRFGTGRARPSSSGTTPFRHAPCRKLEAFCPRPAGMASLISLAMLPHERCRTMMGLAEKDATNYRKVAVAVAFSWSGLCPFLRVELLQSRGPWHRLFSRLDGQAKNIYIICLFIHLCLCSSSLPLTVCICMTPNRIIVVLGTFPFTVQDMPVSSMNQSEGRQRHHPVLLMVDFVVVCWLSYGVMAQLATFGAPHLNTAMASLAPWPRPVPSSTPSSSSS
ncbi:hypothetical protein P4O66_014615 [Electrophorus voltai]|uniref:Uncharacterized protein n=1 Tax=Electrophorus voltai TaxID=2609070 RepID=A0AAD8Z0L8_9TELE|nr:hypothetical protein P4O66_014615 [Electrophorus voltai]